MSIEIRDGCWPFMPQSKNWKIISTHLAVEATPKKSDAVMSKLCPHSIPASSDQGDADPA